MKLISNIKTSEKFKQTKKFAMISKDGANVKFFENEFY